MLNRDWIDKRFYHVTVNYLNSIDGMRYFICVLPVSYDSARTIKQYSQNVYFVPFQSDVYVFSGNVGTDPTQREKLIKLFVSGGMEHQNTGDWE